MKTMKARMQRLEQAEGIVRLSSDSDAEARQHDLDVLAQIIAAEVQALTLLDRLSKERPAEFQSRPDWRAKDAARLLSHAQELSLATGEPVRQSILDLCGADGALP